MSTTLLKIIALIIMTLDHITEFIPGAPPWFRLIGRISAPIFFFSMAWGFYYTRDRKVYLLRIYIIGVCMALTNDLLDHFMREYRTIEITNNIFMNLFVAGLIILIIDTYKANKEKGKVYIRNFIVLQIISTAVLLLYDIYVHKSISFIQTMCALSMNAFTPEGGLPFVILPIVLYYSKQSKKRLTINYIGFCIIYTFFYVMDTPARVILRLERLLPDVPYQIYSFIPCLLGMKIIPVLGTRFFEFRTDQWLMIFSLPFMLLYNGRKGRGFKYFFYIYYPLHVYILYFIGIIVWTH